MEGEFRKHGQKGFSETMTFENAAEWSQREKACAATGEKSCGVGKSKCTGPMAGMCMAGLKNKETSVTGVEYVRERINRREGQRGNQGVAKYGRSSRFFWMRWSKRFGGKWGTWADSCYYYHLVRVENRLKRGQGQEKENQCGGCCNNPGKVWSGQINSRGKSEM